eukprot:m.205782 g.205782  ORF g.205782 m.205782 type:complete len:179 (-) comp15790_c0_seq1:6844-7380(-)
MQKILAFNLMHDDVTPYAITLASLGVLLHKYTREENIIVGSSTSAFNPLLVKLEVKDNLTLAEVLEGSKVASLEAETHELPFTDLVRNLKTKEESPLDKFQVCLFNTHDVNTDTVKAVPCDWQVFVEQRPDVKRLLPLRFRAVYNSLVFSRTRMSEFYVNYSLLLYNCAKIPIQRFGM